MKKIVRNIVIVVLVLVVLVGAVGCLVVTEENEYTIVRQFGKVVDIRATAGVSFKLPFIQETQTLPNTVLLYDLPVSDVITKDKKTMVADSFVLWRIEDPQRFIQTLNSSVTNAESRLSTLVYNAMKTTISGMNQSEVISGRDGSWPAPSRTASPAWISTASKSSPWRPSASTCPTTTRRPSTSV